MKISFKSMINLTSIFLFLALNSACKKDDIPAIPPAAGDVTILKPDSTGKPPTIKDSTVKDSSNIGKLPETGKPSPFEPPVDIPGLGETMEVGTGSGMLKLDGLENKKITIKPGTYSGFEFKNFKNVTISGGNQVKVEGGNVNLFKMNGVTLMNFDIRNSSYRAIQIFEEANDLILKDLNISNIGDYCITFRIDKPYNGQATSYSNNIQLINIVADNIQSFFVGSGSITNNGFTGLVKNFKMSNCTIKNSPKLSDGVWLGCAEDYEFSNNRIDNVNSQQGNHNGIFHIVGTGKVFNNTCTNHQGNMIRAWMASITKPGAVEIYNNVVWNSSRYGAFEIQVPPSLKEAGAFKPGIVAKVYNNTVGQLNTGMPKYFEGRLLDLYPSYAPIEVYNNLVFNNRDAEILNNSSDRSVTPITKNSNNVYKYNAADAVQDLVNFRSKISGVGAAR